MRIFIISRTIFPDHGPRSTRTTELAKELARQGHEVIVYAVLGHYDYSHFEENHNLKIKNIGPTRFATYNSDENFRNNLFDKISRRLFGRLLEYPDIELAIRIPRLIKIERKIDILISIAKPYSIHWGCALAKQLFPNRFPNIWIADCGDPYFGNKVEIPRPPFYFKFVEKWFCNLTDFITVPLEEAKDGYFIEFHNKIKVIPQGLRIKDYNISIPYIPNNLVTFAYAGSIYDGVRDPSTFLNFLGGLQSDFLFIVYTNYLDFFEKFKNKLGARLQLNSYISRQSLIFRLSKVDFLINLSNSTNIQSPSKLIDYALTQRPVLSISTPFQETEAFYEFLNGTYKNKMKLMNKDEFDISRIAKRFVDLAVNK